ncbi:hypothetical protein [Polaromonas sp.]|uniref:hypothetical protein n=1 Tax=Polaromonas sp. TaxID=1869339 RepID=UPI003CAB2099
MPALAQPALPLQTMNAHCIAVRVAANEANNPLDITPQEFDRLITMARLQVRELREAFAFCRGDLRLEARCEAAGMAAKALLTSLEVKRARLVGGI